MLNQYRYAKVLLVFAVTGCFCVAIGAPEEIRRERPGTLFSPSRIPLLEDPGRDVWQKPDEVLKALDIKRGQVVADIGAGSGYLTAKLSERVGESGIVYAVDIQQEMVAYARKKLMDRGLKNVVVVLGDMDDPKLPPEKMDTIILLSTYHEIAKPIEFMKKLKLALKPRGKLAILEFTDESPIGPPLKFRLPEDVVMDEMQQADFILLQKHTLLLPYQCFLVFTASNS
ncbi:MAG: SAM-dependent methyltransferase [Candidatus Brocadia sp. WS118]|nr:MAG: SAM-dependent methyltransferase [Candidatus Brocadia sp. WS118]